MSENWLVFKLEELDTIAFECPNCKTRVLFSAKGDGIGDLARTCPGCNKEIPGAGSLLNRYRNLYREGTSENGLKTEVTLRARVMN